MDIPLIILGLVIVAAPIFTVKFKEEIHEWLDIHGYTECRFCRGVHWGMLWMLLFCVFIYLSILT